MQTPSRLLHIYQCIKNALRYTPLRVGQIVLCELLMLMERWCLPLIHYSLIFRNLRISVRRERAFFRFPVPILGDILQRGGVISHSWPLRFFDRRRQGRRRPFVFNILIASIRWISSAIMIGIHRTAIKSYSSLEVETVSPVFGCFAPQRAADLLPIAKCSKWDSWELFLSGVEKELRTIQLTGCELFSDSSSRSMSVAIILMSNI